MADSVQKRLTVTFKDVAVQVASLGENYGSTVASVVADLVPTFSKRAPLTVSLLANRGLVDEANSLCRTFCKGFLVRCDLVKWYLLFPVTL